MLETLSQLCGYAQRAGRFIEGTALLITVHSNQSAWHDQNCFLCDWGFRFVVRVSCCTPVSVYQALWHLWCPVTPQICAICHQARLVSFSHQHPYAFPDSVECIMPCTELGENALLWVKSNDMKFAILIITTLTTLCSHCKNYFQTLFLFKIFI